MSPLDTLLNVAHIETPNLTEAEETALVIKAREGCDDSTLTLLTAYAPLIKANYRRRERTLDPEDVKCAILLGFTEALHEFDAESHLRLAAVLPHNLKRQLAELNADSGGFSIPTRTMSRWVAITAAADQNIALGMKLAPEYQMSTNTYLDIYKALRDTGSLGLELELSEHDLEIIPLIDVRTPEPVDEDDLSLVEMVFTELGDTSDLTPNENKILKHAYGFEGQAKTDDLVAYDLGLTRPTVQRHRTNALKKGRKRLGLAS